MSANAKANVKTSMKNNKVFLMVLSMLTFSTAVVAGDEERFYVKLNLGASTFPAYDVGAGATLTRKNSVGDAWALGVGLEMSEFFSFELRHNEFGKSSGRFDTDNVAAASYVTDLSSNSLSIIPTVPLGDKTRFFIELGEHVWESSTSFSNAASQSSDGSNFFYVLGFSYDVNDNFRTGFEHARYSFSSEHLNVLNVSLTYLF